MLGRQVDENHNNNNLWRMVWGMRGPPKPCHFVWQACRGTMAVKEELFRRHITHDELCSCCGIEVESFCHVLFECEVTKVVWEASHFGQLVREAPMGSFASKFEWWVG